MKKSLLALAVLGAFASAAQAQVTIGGWMSIQAKDYKLGTRNAARTAGQNFQSEYRIDDDSNSRIWFTGKEDLGGGMDAHFYMESRFGADDGSTATTFGLAAGDTFVGLGSTAVGTLDFGRMTTMYTQGVLVEADRVLSGANLGSISFLDDIGGQAMNGKSRLNNFVRYKTPVMGGFQGTLALSPATGASEGQAPAAGAAVNNDYSTGKAIFAVANYTNGPIYANLAYFSNDIEGRPTLPGGYGTFAQADQRQVRLSGSYKFPFGLKVGLSVDKSYLKNVAAGSTMGVFTQFASYTAANGGGTVAVNGAVSRTAWLLPVSYDIGNGTIYAKFGKAGNLRNWNASAAQTGGTGAKFYDLSYDYALSKRTAVGVSYMMLKNDGNGTYQPFASGSTHTGSGLYAGEKASQLAFNMRHSF
jgi:predicted porin